MRLTTTAFRPRAFRPLKTSFRPDLLFFRENEVIFAAKFGEEGNRPEREAGHTWQQLSSKNPRNSGQKSFLKSTKPRQATA